MDNKELEIKKIIQNLDKMGWTFDGFDKLNFGNSFTKVREPFRYLVRIGYENITFDCARFNEKKFDFEHASFTMFKEFELFYKLYDYVKTTRRMLPNDLAKHQKDLDMAFKWEMGETYCTFENGVLSCGVVDDEDE